MRSSSRRHRLVALLLAVLCGFGVLTMVPSTAQAATNNDQIAFDYFVNKGLTKVQSAAIVGNLNQESGVPINPYAVQSGGAGRGIAQWSAGGRWNSDPKDNMVWYASLSGRSAWSLNAQLDFVWYELRTFSRYGLADLRASTTVESAVLAFQNKFEGCGTCHYSTRVMYAKQALSKWGGVTPPAPTTETSLPTLRKGSTGTAVKTLQYALRANGYSLAADGQFGPATDSAVRSLQRARGLQIDGIVGPLTWNAALPLLRYGSKGEAVKGLQVELRAEGYSLTVDGSFGPATLAAVKSYQSKKALTVDGVVGMNTWGSLID